MNLYLVEIFPKSDYFSMNDRGKYPVVAENVSEAEEKTLKEVKEKEVGNVIIAKVELIYIDLIM